MAFSSVVAFFIMLTVGPTLHAHGITEIYTSAQAAKVLDLWRDDLPFSSLCAVSYGPGCSLFHCWPHRRAMELARRANGEPASSASLKKRSGFMRPSLLATLIGRSLNFLHVDSCESSLLGRDSERSRRSAIDGRDHDHDFQPEGDGQACHPAPPQR
jgi:hypothetical protein